MAKYIDAEKIELKYEFGMVSDEGIICIPMRDVKKSIDSTPAADVVHIDEVFRLIAGHSNYHGDDILSALMCVAEGKEVKPIKPLTDVAEVKHGCWATIPYNPKKPSYHYECSRCGLLADKEYDYCHCGAKMDGRSDT